MLYIVEGGRRSKRPAPRLARGRGVWIDAHGTPIDDAGPQARSLARANLQYDYYLRISVLMR
jgi:hypothetical protein